jgi:hypothetical protein
MITLAPDENDVLDNEMCLVVFTHHFSRLESTFIADVRDEMAQHAILVMARMLTLMLIDLDDHVVVCLFWHRRETDAFTVAVPAPIVYARGTHAEKEWPKRVRASATAGRRLRHAASLTL